MPTGLLLGSASLLALAVAAPFLASPIAKTDVLLTEVPEGTVKFVIIGDSLNHILMSYKGRHLNDPQDRTIFDPSIPEWEVISHGQNRDKEFDKRFLLFRMTGTYWVGIPPWRSVKKYHFRWNERRIGKGGQEEVWSRPDREYGDPEHTNIMYVSSFPYEFILDGAETEDGFPTRVWCQVVLRVTNPYKAMFDTENWLQVVSAAVNGIVKDYVGHETFDNLRSELKKGEEGQTSADSHAFSKQVCELTHGLPDDPVGEVDKYKKGLLGRFGVTLDFATIQDIAPGGMHAGEYEKALAQGFLADKEAEAIAKRGRANAGAELDMGRARAKSEALMGTAQAWALRSRLRVLKDAGKLGELLVQTDAMKADGPGKTIVWANNPFLRQAGITENILEAANIKTPEDLERFIREMMKKEEVA